MVLPTPIPETSNLTDRLTLASDFHKVLEEMTAADRRQLITTYLEQYLSIFYFEILEDAIIYLMLIADKMEIPKDEVVASLLPHVEQGIHEYCSSLNHASAAIYILLTEKKLCPRKTLEVLNQILEAYCCSEPEAEVIDDQGNLLATILNELGFHDLPPSAPPKKKRSLREIVHYLYFKLFT